MFCPKCGKKGPGLCLKCFLEVHPPGLKKFELPICKCGRYFRRGEWNINLEDSISEVVKQNLIIPAELKIKDMNVRHKFEKNKFFIHINIFGKYKGENFSTEFEDEIKIVGKRCPTCAKVSSRYYEAILQFRTGFNLTTKLSKLRGQCPRINPAKDINPEFVSDIKKVPGGIDFYVTSMKYAKQVGAEFRNRGFYVKESAKLIGMKEGKSLYRLNIAIKSPNFEVGDFLDYKGKILQVLEFGKIVFCRDILRRKKLIVPLPKLQDVKPVAHKDDVDNAIVSAILPNEIQVLDIETGKTYEIPGIFENLTQGREIRILRLGSNVYIV